MQYLFDLWCPVCEALPPLGGPAGVTGHLPFCAQILRAELGYAEAHGPPAPHCAGGHSAHTRCLPPPGPHLPRLQLPAPAARCPSPEQGDACVILGGASPDHHTASHRLPPHKPLTSPHSQTVEILTHITYTPTQYRQCHVTHIAVRPGPPLHYTQEAGHLPHLSHILNTDIYVSHTVALSHLTSFMVAFPSGSEAFALRHLIDVYLLEGVSLFTLSGHNLTSTHSLSLRTPLSYDTHHLSHLSFAIRHSTPHHSHSLPAVPSHLKDTHTSHHTHTRPPGGTRHLIFLQSMGHVLVSLNQVVEPHMNSERFLARFFLLPLYTAPCSYDSLSL